MSDVAWLLLLGGLVYLAGMALMLRKDRPRNRSEWGEFAVVAFVALLSMTVCGAFGLAIGRVLVTT